MPKKARTSVPCDNDRPILKAVPSEHGAHSRTINADRSRVQFLACSIFPGDGFRPADDVDVAAMLFELLSIIASYDEAEDREFLIFAIGEAIYPTTFEGQAVINAYIARCASPKIRKQGT